MFDVTSYGAVGDGTTDDRSAIQDAIDACEAAGGGVVYFPKGDYFLNSFTDATWLFCLQVSANNVTLRGDGPGITILRMPNVIGSPINFGAVSGGGSGVKNVAVESMEINGGWNLTDSGSQSIGIRGGSEIDGLRIENVYVHHLRSYGIGLQFDTVKNCYFNNVVVEDTGGDGIDIKNRHDDNFNNRMSNITVRRAGLRSDVAGQACIDLRGPWNCNNISCFEFSDGENTNCQSGIRFRPGTTADESGTGGHLSTLTNFHIDAGSFDTEVVGVHINAYGCTVSGGTIINTRTGVQVDQRECSINAVYVEGANNGFMVEDSSAPTNGDRVILTGCVSRGHADSGFKIYTDNVILHGISSVGGTNGVNLRNGSVNTIIGGLAWNNSTNFQKQSAGLTWTNAGFVF